MAITTTLRFGLAQWSAGTDPYRRAQVDSSFANIEARGAGYLQGIGTPAAGPEYEGFFFFDTDINALYYCDGAQWWFLVGAEGGFAAPSSLSFLTTSSNTGTLNQAARSDHEHPMPGFGSPVAIGVALSPGTGSTVARANHVHTVGSGAINDANFIAAGAVGATALAPDSVTSDKLAPESITNAKISNSAVSTGKLQDGSVTSGKLTDGAITSDKLGNIDASKVGSGVFDTARIPNLDSSKITSGTISALRLPESTYIPPGVIIAFPSITPPLTAGTWILCDGSAISRTTYSDLHTIISAAGYPYGSGDGSTTFNVPNLTGRFPLGKSAAGTGSTLGSTGGSFDHTHTGALHAHTFDPPSTASSSDGSHTHTQPSTVNSAGGHSHTLPSTGSANATDLITLPDGTVGLVTKNQVDHSHSHSHSDGSYDTDNAAGATGGSAIHDHAIGGSTGTATPGLSVSRSHDHTHTTPDTGSTSSHTHSLGSAESGGSHTHTLDIASHLSGDGTGGGANNQTTASNPSYLSLAFFIKT